MHKSAAAHLYVRVHASHIHIHIQDYAQVIKDAQPLLSICCDVIGTFKHIISKSLRSNVGLHVNAAGNACIYICV